jgi:MFS family permease
MLRGIPPKATDAPKARPQSVKAEIVEGLVTIWRSRTLRSLAWALAAWQVFRHAFIAIVVLYCARDLAFTAGQVGATFMAAGIGSLAAASFTSRLNAHFGMGPTMLIGITGTGVAWIVMGSAMGPFWLSMAIFATGMFLLDLTAMVFFINYLTLRQAVTPDRLLGRVTASMICLSVSTAPLGGVLGGWIAEHYGLRAAMLFAGVGALVLGPLVAKYSPLASMRELPKPQEPTTTESVTEELAGD